MQKSAVYKCDLRARPGLNLLQKLENLARAAGMESIDFHNKFVAIKIHFGEPGNLSFLRANYAKVIADMIKAKGGKPFLTDCNTLYVGQRKNALDHLNAAYENGYTPFSTGCQVIIADGLKGTDEALVPIDLEYVKQARIGHAVMDADIVISLSHFKGHEGTGFGGALKNVGMGCGSRAGKMDMHNGGKPGVTAARCVGCGLCARQCAHGAISFDAHHKAVIDRNKCVGCGRCIGTCNFDAIAAVDKQSYDVLNCKIAEYTYAVLKDRPHFHISLVIDVSPFCDCHSENDVPIVPDVGMFASFDPVALDMACADAVNAQPPIPGSRLGLNEAHAHDEGDHFDHNHPVTNWRSCLDHAEKIGLGTKAYDLIEL